MRQVTDTPNGNGTPTATQQRAAAADAALALAAIQADAVWEYLQPRIAQLVSAAFDRIDSLLQQRQKPVLLDGEHAAQMLGVSRQTLNAWVKAGVVPVAEIDGRPTVGLNAIGIPKNPSDAPPTPFASPTIKRVAGSWGRFVCWANSRMSGKEISEVRRTGGPWAYVFSVAVAIALLLADLALPRGATAAIGYCLIPLLAAATGRTRFLLGMTIACSALTWIGYFLESSGAPWWTSAFDRTLVIAILWLSFALARHCMTMIVLMASQTSVLKNAKNALERSNTELARFGAAVAHDLRAPLNTIGLFAELLSRSRNIQADQESVESIRSIEAEVRRMSDLIRSLLNFGRAESSGPQLVDCDCNAVVAAVRENMKADLERSGAQISYYPLPTVRANPVLMAQLFQNLIENSIKYCGVSPPKIRISIAQQADYWLFSIRDNGAGIPAETQERIFEPFHQGDGCGQRLGVGLGLATCKRIVERQGGRIGVESKLGAGATFFFTVPRQADPASQTAMPAASDYRGADA